MNRKRRIATAAAAGVATLALSGVLTGWGRNPREAGPAPSHPAQPAAAQGRPVRSAERVSGASGGETAQPAGRSLETTGAIEPGELRPDLLELARLAAEIREGRPGSDRNLFLYKEAFDGLASRGKAAVGPLGSLALDDPDPAVRTYAIGVLAQVGGDDAARVLARVLAKESEPPLRLAAAEALARSGSDAAGDALLASFRERPDDPHRHRIAALLGRVGAREAARDLAEAAASDLDPSVRLAALSALAALDPARAREAAESAATDENEPVRARARAILER
ncbi:MAG: HEAT repeat domain-containing protein [Planctomycetes bacterium]|nr:HEAT repeat domain-containing protein [Planctomycetota bacterium]